MAKTTFTAEQKAILADLKKRDKRGVYSEISVDVPYSVFEDFISNAQYALMEEGMEKSEEELMVMPEVREYFESELQNLTLDDLSSCYGIEVDPNEFITTLFCEEINAAIAEQERLEEEEIRKEEEEEARREAERRAKMQQIDVTGENYSKAVAVLRAAGLI